jgi:hypothetical protein
VPSWSTGIIAGRPLPDAGQAVLVVEVGVAVGGLIVALGNLEEALSLVVGGFPQAGINTRR